MNNGNKILKFENKLQKTSSSQSGGGVHVMAGSLYHWKKPLCSEDARLLSEETGLCLAFLRRTENSDVWDRQIDDPTLSRLMNITRQFDQTSDQTLRPRTQLVECS